MGVNPPIPIHSWQPMFSHSLPYLVKSSPRFFLQGDLEREASEQILKSQKTRPARPFCRIQSHPNHGVLHPVLSRVWFSLLKDSIGRWDCHVRPFATDRCDPFPFRGSAKKDKKAQPPALVARCRKWQKASRVSTPTSSSRCMLGAQTSRLKEG